MAHALLLAITDLDPRLWLARFRALAPERDIRLAPDQIGDPADIAYACAWKPPAGLLARLPHLKAVFSLGAGVDALVQDPSLPDVPVVRVVNADLTGRMTEYVVMHTLMIQRRQRLYDRQQRAAIWRDHDDPAAGDVAVGIMGLGVLGRHAAQMLARIGFQVAGWSASPKEIPGVTTFDGRDGLNRFLARTEILICLLPLTPATQGILNRAVFAGLKRDGALGGAYLINAGRGLLQVDADILVALDDGTLAGAVLDVFPTEPLPQQSPFWRHPGVTVTPHNAAVSDVRAIAAYVLRQIDNHERGEPLAHVVDRRRGY